MSLSRTMIAARLRGRWSTLVAVAVLAGLGLGGSAAAIAIARRTDSAYRRVAESRDAVHLEWGYRSNPQELYDKLQAEPNPALGTVRQWVGFVDVFDELGVAPDILAPWRSDTSLENPFLFEGALPEEENELVVNAFTRDHSGVQVGDSLTLGLMKSDFSEAVPYTFVITGVVTFASEFGMADDTIQTPLLHLSRAFGEAHPELIVWFSAGAVLDGDPPTRVEASELTQQYGWTLENISVEKEANVRAASRPSVTSLLVLGALGLVSSVAVLAFSLSRELDVWSRDRSVLRALGASRRRRRLPDTLYVLAVTGSAIVVALPTLIALSWFGPVGDLRGFDNDIGFRMDPVAAGAVVVSGAIASFVAVNLANRQRSASHVVPAYDIATSLLAGTASSSRRTVGMTMLLGLLAVAAAAATIPYVTSLSTLVEEPARYGQPWNVMARNRWGDQATGAIAEVVADPSVTAASTISSGSVTINDRLSAPASGYAVAKGEDLLTIVHGRSIQGENEAVIGAATREQLGVELGDTVSIERFQENSFGVACCGPAQEVTLVGDALFPAVGVPGGSVPRLNQGILVGVETWTELTGVKDLPEVTLLSTASTEDAKQLAALFPEIDDAGPTSPRTEWFIGARPAEIRNVESARTVMIGGLAALSAVIAGVLGLALRTVLFGQRRDLAILRALGATRSQVRRWAWREGAILFLPLTLLGVPVGLAFGRLLYSRLATSIGVVSEPETSWRAVAAFIVAIATMSAMSVAASGRSAGNVAPAVSLREP